MKKKNILRIPGTMLQKHRFDQRDIENCRNVYSEFYMN